MEKKGIIEEFKEFISRGNVLDMAIGVIIGGAFGKITSSLVNDVIMPVVSILTGGIEFKNWKIVLKEAVNGADGMIDATTEVAINFGSLVATIIDFLIIAFTVFSIIKLVNRFKNKLLREEEAEKEVEEEAEKEPSEEVKLLTEIRDALKNN
ncbi:MAG: large-conductance mechanosensitive channel protein MscL [Erysipelotrichaceae bacterium]|jgi:large conductance mechanosensitive channel